MNARQKSLLSLLAAAGVVVGLGLYAYQDGARGGDPAPPPPSGPEKLFADGARGGPDAGPTQAPVVTGITVVMPLSTTVMERREGGWFLTAPVAAPADPVQVSALVDALTSVTFKSTLEGTPTDEELARYGLKTPEARVTARAYVPDAQGAGAEDPARQRTLSFQLGASNPFDDSVYVRREGDPRVHVAPGALRFAVMQPTDAWRDRRIFAVDEASLLRIDVKTRENAYTLERATTDKPWELTQPVRLRADPAQVFRMMNELRERLALGFPQAEREAQARQALEKPQVEASFVPKNGGPLRMRLVELKLDGFDLAFALVTSDTQSVLAQVDSATLRILDVPVRQFRDKRVLAVSARDVQEVVIHPAADGELVRLVRAPDTQRWEVDKPMHGVAREFKVASLLNALEKLEALGITDTRPRAWSRYGIGDTSRGVTLLDGAGQVLARLWLGQPVKDNSSRVWARGSGEDVFELDKAALEALPLKLEDFMEVSPGAPGPR